MADQRYVSNELTHFVGRAKADEGERYDVLLKILQEGCLRASGSPAKEVDVALDPFGLRGDELVSVHAVCFCDIPVMDLQLHMQKYKRVGLSFRKAFLVNQGANPVFYVVENAPIPVLDVEAHQRAIGEYRADHDAAARKYGLDYEAAAVFKHFTRTMPRKQQFYETASDYNTVFPRAFAAMRQWQGDPLLCNAVQEAKLLRLQDFMSDNVYAFVKMFDASHAEAHDKNYYMEREWRVIGDITFMLGDVERIILPDRAFGRRFRHDVPDFDGQVTFAE